MPALDPKIRVAALGAGMKKPERPVAMHFFKPAPLMALVEVVMGLAISKAVAVADTVHAKATAWGKKPVYATSTPGFIVNRVARPFYAESLRLLQEQATDAATLDAIVREAGQFPMGAFELADLIDHDINYAVTNSVFNSYFQNSYAEDRYRPALLLRKNAFAQKGFYS